MGNARNQNSNIFKVNDWEAEQLCLTQPLALSPVNGDASQSFMSKAPRTT